MMGLPIIHGFNQCSEIGVDTFAPSIFLYGCNLRCPYCMNSKIVTHKSDRSIDIEEIREYLKTDKSEWLMISGGEPTITPIDQLKELLVEIKGMDRKIGMSTNGTNPGVLSSIIKDLSYVAMDIKAIDYNDIGYKDAFTDVLCSKGILMVYKKLRFETGFSDFDYEIRTTLYPDLINASSIDFIGHMIEKDETWVLQQFRHANSMIEDCTNVKPYDEDEVEELLKIAKKYSPKSYLRYV